MVVICRKKLLIYFAWIAAFCVVSVIFKQSFYFIPAVALMLALIISFFLFRHDCGGYSLNVSPKSVYVEINQQIIYNVKCSFSGHYPISHISVSFKLLNRFIQRETTKTFSFVIFPGKENIYNIPVDTFNVGMVSFEVTEVKVSDMLGIAVYSLPVQSFAEIPVLPNLGNEDMDISSYESEGLEEEYTYDRTMGLSSEVKNIREYRIGDRIQYLHWKITAKLDDYYIKEMDSISKPELVIIPVVTEINVNDTCRVLREVVESLIGNDTCFYVALYDYDKDFFEYINVFCVEDMIDMFVKLYKLPYTGGKTYVCNKYHQAEPKSVNVFVIDGNETELSEAV